MIVVHSAEVSTLYPRIVILSLIRWLENLLFAILYTSYGVWFKDHYMPLQRLTLVHMTCFALGFASLISQQAVPYQTYGDTCCSSVSTTKIWSLADSSMMNHITYRIPTVFIISTYAQTTASILTQSTHISTNGRPNSHTNTQDILNIIKMKDLYDTHDCRAKQYYLDINPNPKGISRYSI
jgi:hypothetical protein